MHSVKKVIRVVPVPQGYDGPEEGASIPQDDACSVISDAADYPEEQQSDVEYISDYELEESEVSSGDTTDVESESPKYKAMDNILTEEYDFAEIKF